MTQAITEADIRSMWESLQSPIDDNEWATSAWRESLQSAACICGYASIDDLLAAIEENTK